jgi:hypothetical protein
MLRRSSAFLVLLFSLNAFPCSRIGPVSSVEMVNQADVIIRATAEKYDVAPSDPHLAQTWKVNRTTHVPDPIIRFQILEVIRGESLTDLTLHGYLNDRDDFNDRPSPYNFVRPGGRHGNCVAYNYRSGAQFLLLLKKQESGELTVNWYPLGPVNEQLHSEDDPWLLWVRSQALKRESRK